MFEKAYIRPPKAGETCVITFEQKMDLQGGEYLISFGCTGYRNGDFHVVPPSLRCLQHHCGVHEKHGGLLRYELKSDGRTGLEGEQNGARKGWKYFIGL